MRIWRVEFTDGTSKTYKAPTRRQAARLARRELTGRREIRSIYEPRT